MRLRLLLALLIVPLVASGCVGAGPDAPPPGAGGPADGPLEAPWWSLGESWTIEFTRAGAPARTTTLVNFANNTFGDPAHFWLGTRDRDEAMEHVFHETNPFLGRIHWEILAPHEKGMHSAMYTWPLDEGTRWTSPLLFGKTDLALRATERHGDGRISVHGEARADGSTFAYDYDPATRWFRELTITGPTGTRELHARVVDHAEGATGTFHFLRGRDYLDADGGRTGEEDAFRVVDEGATSVAFLVDVQASPGSRLEFVAPDGSVFHSETLLGGGTVDRIFEAKKAPPAGDWKLRYVGTITGEIKVRGIVEYKATL